MMTTVPEKHSLQSFQVIVLTTKNDAASETSLSLKPNERREILLLHADPRVRSITLTSTLEAHASITWHILSLAQASLECSVVSELKGEHATSSINWISYAREKAKHTLTATNRFLAPSGSGEIVMKGVAEGTGSVKFSGVIEIGEEGAGTETHLTQHVLMLDRTAKVDAVPGLEIRTNDVKASHSATVSRVTPEDLFYFQSRGIEEKNARRMYVEGFLQSLFENITDARARRACTQALRKVSL